MSTHDMYFSKENKNYIFNIIQDLVLKETEIDINNNKEYIDLYRFKYPLIFERSTSDNLIDLNKELIDEIGSLLINDIINKKKYSKNISEKENFINTEIEKPIKEEIKIEKFKKHLHFNSTDNIKININRYNYYIKLPNNNSEFKIKEIVIPVEDNILFSNPIIFININDYKIKFTIFNSLIMNNLTYNIYKPIEDIIIKNKKKLVKIEILNNLNMKIYEKNDKIIIKKIKQITIDKKKYLALRINNLNSNLKDNDSITIYKENKPIKTMNISKIIDDILLFENQNIEIENNLFLINTNLQNNITICL